MQADRHRHRLLIVQQQWQQGRADAEPVTARRARCRVHRITDAFHLVIPSLPGYGFSGPLTETGWTDGRTAAALVELMARLGYDRYGVQGGDVGAFIAPLMGRLAPDRVIGVHVNALVTFPSGDPADMAALTLIFHRGWWLALCGVRAAF